MPLIVDFNRQEYAGGDVVRARVEYLDEDGRPLRSLGRRVEWIAAQIHAHALYNSHLVSPPVYWNRVGVRLRGGDSSPSRSESRGSVLATPLTKQRYATTAMPDFSRGSFFGNETTSSGGAPSSSMNESVCIFSSKPCVLAANLNPSEATMPRYVFEAVLPRHIPPSFRGHSVRYVYYLTIGVKIDGEGPVQLTHVPFPVRCSLRESSPRATLDDDEEDELVRETRGLNCFPNPILDKADLRERAYVAPDADDEEEFLLAHSPGVENGEDDDDDENNPNEKERDRNGSFIPIGRELGHEQSVEREARPPFLLINAVQRSKLIARCAIFPTRGLRRGDTLTLKLDVADADIPLVRVVVALETEERATREPPIRALFETLLAPTGAATGTIAAPRRSSHLAVASNLLLEEAAGSSASSSSSSSSSNNSKSDAVSWVRTVERCVREVGNRLLTAVQIPTGNATPDFSTDLVTVRNFLRVEFISSPASSGRSSSSYFFSGGNASAPLILRIPLVVRP